MTCRGSDPAVSPRVGHAWAGWSSVPPPVADRRRERPPSGHHDNQPSGAPASPDWW